MRSIEIHRSLYLQILMKILELSAFKHKIEEFLMLRIHLPLLLSRPRPLRRPQQCRLQHIEPTRILERYFLLLILSVLTKDCFSISRSDEDVILVKEKHVCEISIADIEVFSKIDDYLIEWHLF